MSVTDPADAPNEKRLEQFLLEKARDGEFYFKSKFIADDVGLSPKQIGALMSKLRDSTTELEIERWSYTGATTWHIAPAGTTETAPPLPA
ncbi:hypothetical protein SAMN04487948_12336 [Halogranum amylolyticum]|uniref:DUF7123 domain-containing protein n=2 Tax=Halogranum amylolyticum TaxID=660520 RepID=A0A1H8W5E8_9EURY|nr:hypothetical protein [Halogranum amylolyticum]SEP22667.1 hypothetical protein SAMN04487948_12336 [Halogranum amylolyticum]